MLVSVFGLLLFGYNNCGKVQFSNSPAADVSTTGTGNPTGGNPTDPCVANPFGSFCSGTPPVVPPNNGAHGYFYNLTPIQDPNGSGYVATVGAYAGMKVDGSMSLLNSQSVIPNLNLYATQVNVPDQPWTQGFPGFPNLQEWFGACYDGAWSAPTAGSYTFVTLVDDAIAIWIDGVLVGENDDGTIHQSLAATNNGEPGNHVPVGFLPVALTAGPHSVKIMYYEGWPTALAAQVWVLPAGTSFVAGTTPSDANVMQISSPIGGALACPH